MGSLSRQLMLKTGSVYSAVFTTLGADAERKCRTAELFDLTPFTAFADDD